MRPSAQRAPNTEGKRIALAVDDEDDEVEAAHPRSRTGAVAMSGATAARSRGLAAI